MKINKKNIKIAIIGIGYVGLPLSIEFGKKFDVFGFDNNKKRINQLKKRYDKNLDIDKSQFIKSKFLRFTNKVNDISKCNIFIISVPTPINKKKEPNLKLLKLACKLVGKVLKLKDTVIFESTFYPGLTEEVCVPILQKTSSLLYNKDFFCGYSPERINPSDKKHRLKDIVKITSGSNKYTANFVNNLYKKIITAGTYKASSIKIAEAAKVIENAQRDLNIAFVNELSIIFDKLHLNTYEILKAANTKWNFINYKPGLVGGHCIGVDPYYLTLKSRQVGYNPKIILAGRKLNDSMSVYIGNKTLINMKMRNIKVNKSKILLMGISFKENCKDFRNSKIFDIINFFKNKCHSLEVYDPIVDSKEVYKETKIKLIKYPKKNYYDVILILVNHKLFKKLGSNKIFNFAKKNSVIFDLKNLFIKENNFIR
jgi:UDP-N-acetyl-D-galactosamine dehydrogenase|tara:strand:- start:4427 stop:5704 length:1278 start_codon:yes stop_codon:yes gene_type:complete